MLNGRRKRTKLHLNSQHANGTIHKHYRLWSTMECSQPTAWSMNRSLLVASRVKAYPVISTNSGSALPMAVHLESVVIGCLQCLDITPRKCSGFSWRPTNTPGFVPPTYQPPPLSLPPPNPPCPYPWQCTWKVLWLVVINVLTSHPGSAPASPDVRPTPLGLSRLLTKHHLYPCPLPTHHSHD